MKAKNKTIPANISFDDAKQEIERQFGGLKMQQGELDANCQLTWQDLITRIQVAINHDRATQRDKNIGEA